MANNIYLNTETFNKITTGTIPSGGISNSLTMGGIPADMISSITVTQSPLIDSTTGYIVADTDWVKNNTISWDKDYRNEFDVYKQEFVSKWINDWAKEQESKLAKMVKIEIGKEVKNHPEVKEKPVLKPVVIKEPSTQGELF